MNRKEKRDSLKFLKKKMTESGISKKEKNQFLSDMLTKYNKDKYQEGAKVRLNYQKISERFNIDSNPKFVQWVENHKDEIFTVEYEKKYQKNKTLCVFKEDDSEVRWLWFYQDLILV